MLKFVSWNVNGIRACLKKGFMDYFNCADADIFCIQETKLHEGQVELFLKGYRQYWNYAEKKGYSGTAVFSKSEPVNVYLDGMGIEEHGREGRLLTLEYENFFLVTVYTPNSQRGLTRLEYRMKWEKDFRYYLVELDKKKPVVICGDLNVAHKKIDLKNPSSNRKNAGFTDEEREKFGKLLESGFIDSYRHFYPDREGAYTWWSYFSNARERNVGWRIDYFCVSQLLRDNIKDSHIYPEVMGSDHCPIGLSIDI